MFVAQKTELFSKLQVGPAITIGRVQVLSSRTRLWPSQTWLAGLYGKSGGIPSGVESSTG